MTHPLDNPIWHSLATRHRALAIGEGDVARYPAGVAPFLGVGRNDVRVEAGLEALVATGESVYLLGPVPAVADRWRLRGLMSLAQMVCPDPIVEVDGPEILELGAAHHADVLALTALVYPHFFRPRTTELGRYFGIYRDGQLAAIIGERMGMDGWQEISAVCTHPEHTGRGYARRLLAMLSNDNLARGRRPFLHVSHENRRAKDLYEQVGYRHRRDIGFWSLERSH